MLEGPGVETSAVELATLALVGGGVEGGGGGDVGVGGGFGFDGVGCGFCAGDDTGREIAEAGVRVTTVRVLVGRFRTGRTTCRGGMRTVGAAGAGWITRGVAAIRSSAGELDSNAARQRYPEVTPAATSRQSRSASNEIRTRISIGLLPDSIGADIAPR